MNTHYIPEACASDALRAVIIGCGPVSATLDVHHARAFAAQILEAADVLEAHEAARRAARNITAVEEVRS